MTTTEFNKADFLAAIRTEAREYEYNIRKQKERSSAQEQSTHNPDGTTKKSFSEFTKDEWKEWYEKQSTGFRHSPNIYD